MPCSPNSAKPEPPSKMRHPRRTVLAASATRRTQKATASSWGNRVGGFDWGDGSGHAPNHDVVVTLHHQGGREDLEGVLASACVAWAFSLVLRASIIRQARLLG